ncbi:RNA polymerase sigma-70 factor (ECF subfamily) [Streptomyces sp. PanSC19]|uniref:sigma factor-like helix-turn-helix DNA-binding protein n=1 Tax=Streptomyces sp. PanSC19 TaxID=1520455 RepID=UPI000F48C6CC|nr:sigma factor-like helix-turn-helix DNA-binding protein [Streptomyces sp. PanSC19]ROQ31242.1 RNA polymerase sigma-70 factor (ECF subfamily) [Streptomyces sp. PanSC19]
MHDDTFLTALAGRFDAHEEQLRAVALRIAGSPAEAEAALAAARAELGRDDGATVRAWLTATVGRACVRGLQERGAERRWREGPEGNGRVPGDEDAGIGSGPTPGAGGGAGREPGAGGTGSGGGGAGGGGGRVPRAGGEGAGSDGDTRHDVESLWLALLVMLERLGGEERLAYVLHDVFGLPPYETARIVGGSPDAAARLARRARERLRGGGASRTEGERGRQRAVVDRFLAAARARDARALAAVLAPDVVAYSEDGPVHGVAAVAETAAAFAGRADVSRPALVDGAVGAVGFAAGRPVSAVGATLRRGRIVTLSLTSGEDRVRALDLAFPDS